MTKKKAKVQTRRSVSIRGTTYDHVMAHCKKNKLTVAGFVEDLIARALGGAEDEDRNRDPGGERYTKPLTLVPKVTEAKVPKTALNGSGTHLL
jgi:hypothetical protein